MTKETVTPQDVERARSIIRGSLEHPVNREIILGAINKDISSMMIWRMEKKRGEPYVENPDDLEGRITYGQRACEIYGGEVFLARDIWEDHNDIRERGEIPAREFRVSGELFFLRDIPEVPIIRRCATPYDEDIQALRPNYVLMNPFYKVL